MRALTGIGLFILLIGAGMSLQSQDSTSRFEPVKVIPTAEPIYPPNVVSSGTVVLEVTIATTGKVDGIRVIRAMPPFTQEAVKTVQKWEFEPARLDGEPIRTTVPVVVSFSRPSVWWPQTNQPASGTNP